MLIWGGGEREGGCLKSETWFGMLFRSARGKTEADDHVDSDRRARAGSDLCVGTGEYNGAYLLSS